MLSKMSFNCVQNYQTVIFEWSILKEFVQDKLNEDQVMISVFGRVENIACRKLGEVLQDKNKGRCE